MENQNKHDNLHEGSRNDEAYPAVPGGPRCGVLPWIHRAFSLMKRWSLGTYHGLRRTQVDTYFSEFVFRYNRRFHRHVSFETLLGLRLRATGTSSNETILERASKRSGERPPPQDGHRNATGWCAASTRHRPKSAHQTSASTTYR